MIDTTLSSDNCFLYRKKLLKGTFKTTMTIDEEIIDEKLQHDINREASKLSTLSLVKIHKYEYLTSQEILHWDQSRIIEQAEFTYFTLVKSLKKRTKVIENQREQQI